MIEFANHLDMISCWDEAGRPLDKQTVAVIEDVASDLKRLGYDDYWMVFQGQCRVCNFRQNIICPAGNDIDNQECENCGDMTMMEREVPEWELEVDTEP